MPTRPRLGFGILVSLVLLAAMWGPVRGQAAPGLPDAPYTTAGGPPAGAAPSVEGASGSPAGSEFAGRLLYLVNVERDRLGLLPLRSQEQLARSAQLHSEDMALRDFCGHVGSDGRNPAQRISAQGYAYTIAGENLAAGLTTPERVVSNWLASSGHRANLLNPDFSEAGAGYFYQADDQPNIRLPSGAVVGPYYHYYALVLGARSGSYPVVIDLEASTTVESTVRLALRGRGWAQEMLVSSLPDFAGASWQPFAERLAWTLPAGSGTRRVFARLRNGAGQEVTSSDEIELIGQEPHSGRRLGYMPLITR